MTPAEIERLRERCEDAGLMLRLANRGIFATRQVRS